MSQIQPLGARLLVKPEEAIAETASGLIIPDGANDQKPEVGTVVKLGTGEKDEKGNDIVWNVKEEDKVYFKKYAPEEIEVDGETLFIMNLEDVIAVIK